jgi:hypothetical protein
MTKTVPLETLEDQFAQPHTMLTSITSFLCRLISEPGNPQYMVVIYHWVLYCAYSAGFPLQWLVIHYGCACVGLFVCGIIKICVRSPRPNLTTVYPWDSWLKETRDTNIPSAHSFVGIAMGFCMIDYLTWEGFSDWWWICVVWLFSFPILRYVGHQHTSAGILMGSMIGLICYVCARFVIAQNIPIDVAGIERMVRATEDSVGSKLIHE